MPGGNLIDRAGWYRIEYFRAVERDVVAVQSYLDQRIPVVVVLVGGPEFLILASESIYATVEVDHEESFAHAVLAVGYDDELAAVKVMKLLGERAGETVGSDSLRTISGEQVTAEAYVVGRELMTDIESVDDAGSAKALVAGQEIVDLACAQSPLFDKDADGYPDTLEREFAALGFDPDAANDNPDFEPVLRFRR